MEIKTFGRKVVWLTPDEMLMESVAEVEDNIDADLIGNDTLHTSFCDDPEESNCIFARDPNPGKEPTEPRKELEQPEKYQEFSIRDDPKESVSSFTRWEPGIVLGTAH